LVKGRKKIRVAFIVKAHKVVGRGGRAGPKKGGLSSVVVAVYY